ncbi:hypothetical protein D9M71_593520 [compost metagenome]
MRHPVQVAGYAQAFDLDVGRPADEVTLALDLAGVDAFLEPRCGGLVAGAGAEVGLVLQGDFHAGDEHGAAAIADVAGKAGIGIRDGHAARRRGGRREAGVGECRAGFAVRGFRGDLVVVGIDVVGHGSSVLSAQATRVTSAARACCGVDSW